MGSVVQRKVFSTIEFEIVLFEPGFLVAILAWSSLALKTPPELDGAVFLHHSEVCAGA